MFCFYVMVYCFLSFCHCLHVCMYVDVCMVLCSRIDVEQSAEFAEPPPEFFEQQQDNPEEGKYNMNNTQ